LDPCGIGLFVHFWELKNTHRKIKNVGGFGKRKEK
jgi:hypothetical protein